MNSKQNLLPQDGEAYLFEKFFEKEESDFYFQVLLNQVIWKQEPIILFGKKVMQPRLTALYGDQDKEYKYSGIIMKPYQWIDPLLEIKRKVDDISGSVFTTALLNQYRDEKDSMGWHRDHEKALGKNPIIASVSFGSTRSFILRHYFQKNLKKSLDLSHGSLLLMRGQTQHFWEHSLPKKSKPLETRINITFRKLINESITG